MKKSLSVLLFSVFYMVTLHAQTRTMGPAEKKITDSLCGCISRLDLGKIHTKKEATDAFMDCFSKQSDLLEDLAKEKNVDMTDKVAMHDLGVGIGKDLLNEKCAGFVQLGFKMAQKDETEQAGFTKGKFKRIDNKGVNYVVLVDENNQEKSFLWLRQFTGSESLTNQAAGLIGKTLKIEWKEMEIYLPAAKGYYKVKEITAVTVL